MQALLLCVRSSAPSLKSQDCFLPPRVACAIVHGMVSNFPNHVVAVVSHSRQISLVRQDFFFFSFFFVSRLRVLRNQSCFMVLITAVTRTCLRLQSLVSCPTSNSILYNSLFPGFFTSASSTFLFDILHLLSKLQAPITIRQRCPIYIAAIGTPELGTLRFPVPTNLPTHSRETRRIGLI